MPDDAPLETVRVVTDAMADVHARIVALYKGLIAAELKAHEGEGGRDGFRAELQKELDDYERDHQRWSVLERRRTRRVAVAARAPAATPLAPAAPVAPAIPPEDILAPIVPEEERAPPPAVPPLPPAPGAPTEPDPTETDTEIKRIDDLETEAGEAIRSATEHGITPDTLAKWQDPKVREALRTYATHARTLKDHLLAHNIFLQREKNVAAEFRAALERSLNTIEQYCLGNSSTIKDFHEAVVAVSDFQHLVERLADETRTDIEAVLASIKHGELGVDPKRIVNSPRYVVLDKVRESLLKRKAKYDEFHAEVTRLCGEALTGIDLQIHHEPFPAAVMIPDEQKPVLEKLAAEADRRVNAWIAGWGDGPELHVKDGFRKTALICALSVTLVTPQSSPRLGLHRIIDQFTKEFVLKPTEAEVTEALRAVVSCVDEHLIGLLLPAVDIKPASIVVEGTELGDITQAEIKAERSGGPITQEMARTILSNYRKLLDKSLLTRYAYPATSLQIKRKRIDAAYGPALTELEAAAETWTEGAATRATGAIDALNKVLRADLERVRVAIEGAKANARKTPEKTRVATDAKLMGSFLGSLTQWEGVVDAALRDLPKSAGAQILTGVAAASTPR